MGENREFRLDEISLRSIFKDLLKNLWVIAAAAAAAWLSVTGVEKLTYVPQYTATATLAVNTTSSSSAYTSLSLTSQMAGVFGEIFGSSVLENRICEDLGVDHIDGEITATVIEETNLINLSVTSGDPKQAYLIITSALDNYNTVSEYLFTNAVLRIVREPSVPFGPSNTLDMSRIRNLAMAAGAGTVILIIAGLSALRFTVKTRTGAHRNLDGKILGIISYERKFFTWKELFRKKKRSLLISSLTVSMDFAESLRKAASRLEHHMRQRRQQVLLVASVSENEGKSSVAANLALALSEKGKKVILIDCDLKKPAQYRIFDRPSAVKGWLGDYLQEKCQANDLLSYNRKDHFFSVFQNTGMENSASLLSSDRMKKFLTACCGMVDYVIVDTPPMAACSDAELLMGLSDVAVLVVRQDWSDVRAINDSADAIRRSGIDFAGFVLNAFQKDFVIGHSAGAGYGSYHKYRGQEGGGELG
ncbi:capsular exopolysaccharide synthesis family protein [Catenibacillus scindens]|uniref:Capsular exopolysaccharide synthesis family protein n=1 Tax=Catenibacillus scindens TaxID=673271 RepID=A0A7W8H959_9FIRM|nr:polysaccharide biosynthesis tyrosine autokinase [Catenibacillus scindens]MBB5264194.1 capsular exopolysaccharide synthesis family protein [Catenibacillus scindens]